jgi:uncharacterized protein RhaS with RHS repeats
VEYTYDGQGALVKRTMADGSWTVYIGGIYEKHSDGTYVKYYSALGRRIAMRDNTGVVHYVLADHLGSSTVVTSSTGAVVGTMKYYPYGAMRSTTGTMPTDKLFTGQQREPQAVSALGLYNSCPERSRRACPERCRRDGARFYFATQPQSTRRSVPVMNEAFSLARK